MEVEEEDEWNVVPEKKKHWKGLFFIFLIIFNI